MTSEIQSKLIDEEEITEEHKKFNSLFIKKGSIELREYQLEIVEKAVGNNFLIVMPTGLGKTPTAAMIAAKTIELYPYNESKISKIIILAPNKPLIIQHVESFRKFFTLEIPGEDSALTGKVNPDKRMEYFKERTLLFYTPQTLRNDLINQRYTLDDVCMIIFDEAHRASGNYAYCEIVKIYCEQNPDGNILGLTASPGSNKKKIEELCDNLNIPYENVIIKVRTDENVAKYTKEMNIKKIGVEMNDLMDKILKSLRFDLLYQKIIQLEQLDAPILNYGKPITNSDQIYKLSQKSLIENHNKLIHEKDKNYKAISVNAEALKIYHMINLTERQGLNILYSYLIKLEKDLNKSKPSKALINISQNPYFKHIVRTLYELEKFRPEILIHPKLFKLFEILSAKFKDSTNSNEKPRILIFSEYRKTVTSIVKYLKQYNEFKPKRFVGQATKSKNDKGMSQKEQIETLDKFKSGDFNILVSTSVAEEGLDIAECDMVIFYDQVPSEIRLIQRRGRTARSKKGDVILLYCIGTSDEHFLHLSMSKLNSMQKNLKSKSKKKSKNSSKKKSKFSNKILSNAISKKKSIKKSKSKSNKSQKLIDIKLEKNFDVKDKQINHEIDTQNQDRDNKILSIEFSHDNITITKSNNKNSYPNVKMNLTRKRNVYVDRNISPMIGIRKLLKEKNIDYIIFDCHKKFLDLYGSICPQIIVDKEFCARIINFTELERIFSIIKDEDEYKELIIEEFNKLKTSFNLCIFFLDLSNIFDKLKEYKEEIKQYKESISELFNIEIILTNNPEEILLILKPILGKLMKSEGGTWN